MPPENVGLARWAPDDMSVPDPEIGRQVSLGVKLAVAMLMLAYLLGALVDLGLIASGRKQFSSKLPFGSFLAVSAIIIMLYGEGIVDWYLRLIGI